MKVFLGDSIGGFHMLFVLKDRYGNLENVLLYYHLIVFCVHYAAIKVMLAIRMHM